MKISYYPGCSIHTSSKEYEISAKRILNDLGIELEEIKDWNCCGAIEASALNHFLSVALPARNLAIANSKRIIMLCSACQQVHNKIKEELIENKTLKSEVENTIGKTVNTDIEITHLIYFIAREIEENKIESRIVKPLKGLRVIPYYGCCIDRPSRYVHGDNPDFPVALEKIITILGAEPLLFPYKTRCCGGTLFLPKEDYSFAMSKKILLQSSMLNADCITVACPLCHVTLETFSIQLQLSIPVLYFTQLLGIAFGHSIKELGLNRNLIPADKIMERYE